MSASRDAILAALGSAPPAAAPPDFASAQRCADPWAAFAASLAAAGGRARALSGPAELAAALREHQAELGAERVFSAVDALAGRGPLGPEPHALADLDLAVLPGGPAVAENGAVWIAPRSATERAAAFLARAVALVVPRAALVDELHAAYAAIDPAAGGFGCFVCGPSKTADIAQALVIGAHGPGTLTVFLVGRG